MEQAVLEPLVTLGSGIRCQNHSLLIFISSETR